MPYKLKSFGKGKYKVCKKNSNKCFSKKPLPKARAQAQMAAMHINTNESIELPSEENVIGGEHEQSPYDLTSDENQLLSQHNLDKDQLEAALEYTNQGDETLQNGEHVTDKLMFKEVERKGNQKHYVFSIEGQGEVCLEVIYKADESGVYDFAEWIISDESKEPADENEESVEESLSFESLYDQIMSK